jgi:hypothetical protein
MDPHYGSPLAFALALAGCVLSVSASAHISLERGGTHQSRSGDQDLKDAPCGLGGAGRGTQVYTYAPGETIRVSLAEYITHPGYFRIAFDADGDDDFVDPQSIMPVNPARKCPFNAADQCGASAFYNNLTVLPGMDNLNPHITAAPDQIYTWDVTLPNVACDNCTLQVIQVMEDTIHGAYNTTKGDPNDVPYVADVYHQCIDLVLQQADAGNPNQATSNADASSDDPSGKSGGGCAVTPRPTHTSMMWLGFAFGVCALRRRRS